MKKALWILLAVFIAAPLLTAQTQQSFIDFTGKTKGVSSPNDVEFAKLGSTPFDVSELADQKNLNEWLKLAMSTPNYPVTPGDVYTLSFVTAGGVLVSKCTVAFDYSLDLTNLGKLELKGRTFLEASKLIESRVLQAYPRSAPQVVISGVGMFPVLVYGEVKESKEVYAWGLSRLSEYFEIFSTPFSSYRDIEIVAADGKTEKYDLFKAKRYGDLSQDPWLRAGDRLRIGRLSRSVNLSGKVERPGSYQLLDGEGLQELIEEYGSNTTYMADTSRIKIARISNTSEDLGTSFVINLNKEKVELFDGDSVTIPSFEELRPIFFIEGAVRLDIEGADLGSTNRIEYQFVPGDSLGQIIKDNKTWFSQFSDYRSAYILRNGTSIPADLTQYLFDKNFTQDILLEPSDTLIVPFNQYFVSVAGAVNAPGRYPWVPDRDWRYYIGLAGGIDQEKNTSDRLSIVDRDNRRLPKDGFIPPEGRIEVKYNSFLYYFGRYAPLVTTIVGVVSTTMGIIAIMK